MIYLIEDKKYHLSYKELKESYLEVCNYSCKEFKDNVLKILHLSSIILFLKETPAYLIMGDTGIIHELIHIADGTSIEQFEIEEIMNLFKEQCKLA